MKFVIQRVLSASVTIDHKETRSIGPGLLVYVGISKEALQDWKAKVDKFISKIQHIKVFKDNAGKINSSLTDIGGELMIISNFTLHGQNKKGNQVDFSLAAGFADAQMVYEYLLEQLKVYNISFQAGEFGAYMLVESQVDGPVNVVLER